MLFAPAAGKVPAAVFFEADASISVEAAFAAAETAAGEIAAVAGIVTA